MKTYKVKYELTPNIIVTVTVQARDEFLALQQADKEVDEAWTHAVLGDGHVTDD